MSPTGGTHGRRLLVAAVAALLILGAVATYSVFTHAHRDSAPPVSGPARHPIRPSSQATPNHPATLAPVDATADPATFARRVAAALFDWDTSSLTTPGDSIARLAAVDDPTGESSTALVSDVTTYLPTAAAWAALRQYQTRQWVQVTSLKVPSRWSTAVRQAGPHGLLPGTAAYTIHGIRHRTGIWEGHLVTTVHPVAFTIFLVCGPAYPQCHLLRLSRLDDPLR